MTTDNTGESEDVREQLARHIHQRWVGGDPRDFMDDARDDADYILSHFTVTPKKED